MACGSLTRQPARTRKDPARARGLRRARKLDGVLSQLYTCPLPTAIDAAHLLALMTRSRQARHDATGRPAQKFVCHVGAFTTAYAELGYLRRLAAGGRHGGAIATSMPQLVVGLAVLHPRWDMSGDRFTARDRHHSAVRRRLGELAAIGVLSWRAGVDEDGEERRTEITLYEPPAASEVELAAAGAQLALWQARYGPELSTGASTAIATPLRHGRPLSASERQARGVTRTKATVVRRVNPTLPEALIQKRHPPAGAYRNSSQKHPRLRSMNISDRTRVTRARTTIGPHKTDAPGKLPPAGKTANEKEFEKEWTRSQASAPPMAAVSSPAWQEALIARVSAEQIRRAALLAALAQGAQDRAVELAGWGLERDWPRRRLAEAWVVARYGAHAAADSGTSSAGPLSWEMYDRLRRAVARYERNAAARPEGWPAGGLAALLHLGGLAAAAQLHDPPRTLAYAIGRLHQTATRMRARHSATDPARDERARARATKRQRPAEISGAGPPVRLDFRLSTGRRWPAWILLPGQPQPSFDDQGRLQLDPDTVALYGPSPTSDHYRATLRDAYLLANRLLPAHLHGRRVMAARADGLIPSGQRPTHRTLDQLELAELAHHTGLPHRQLERLSPALRQDWLQSHRRAAAAQAAADGAALRQALSQLHDDRHRGDRP
jgi:hypothetical protein